MNRIAVLLGIFLLLASAQAVDIQKKLVEEEVSLESEEETVEESTSAVGSAQVGDVYSYCFNNAKGVCNDVRYTTCSEKWIDSLCVNDLNHPVKCCNGTIGYSAGLEIIYPKVNRLPSQRPTFQQFINCFPAVDVSSLLSGWVPFSWSSSYYHAYYNVYYGGGFRMGYLLNCIGRNYNNSYLLNATALVPTRQYVDFGANGLYPIHGNVTHQNIIEKLGEPIILRTANFIRDMNEIKGFLNFKRGLVRYVSDHPEAYRDGEYDLWNLYYNYGYTYDYSKGYTYYATNVWFDSYNGVVRGNTGYLNQHLGTAREVHFWPLE